MVMKTQSFDIGVQSSAQKGWAKSMTKTGIVREVVTDIGDNMFEQPFIDDSMSMFC